MKRNKSSPRIIDDGIVKLFRRKMVFCVGVLISYLVPSSEAFFLGEVPDVPTISEISEVTDVTIEPVFKYSEVTRYGASTDLYYPPSHRSQPPHHRSQPPHHHHRPQPPSHRPQPPRYYFQPPSHRIKLDPLRTRIKINSKDISFFEMFKVDQSMFSKNSTIYIDGSTNASKPKFTAYKSTFTDEQGRHVKSILTVDKSNPDKVNISGIAIRGTSVIEIRTINAYMMELRDYLMHSKGLVEAEFVQVPREKLIDHLKRVEKAVELFPSGLMSYFKMHHSRKNRDGTPFVSCGGAIDDNDDDSEDNIYNPLGRDLLALKRWDCPIFPDGQIPRLTVTLLIDYGAAKYISLGPGREGDVDIDKVLAEINIVGSLINDVYMRQLGFGIVFEHVHVATKPRHQSYEWAYDSANVGNLSNEESGCPPSFDELVHKVSEWRNNQDPSQQTGVTHQLTDCIKGRRGEVGKANRAGICSKRRGVSASQVRMDYWLTMAHEIGHNIGAQHPQIKMRRGGIMDHDFTGKLQKSDPDSPEAIGFNVVAEKEDICRVVSRAFNRPSHERFIPQEQCWDLNFNDDDKSW